MKLKDKDLLLFEDDLKRRNLLYFFDYGVFSEQLNDLLFAINKLKYPNE